MRSYLDPDTRGGLLRMVPPSLVRLFAILAVLFSAALVASVVTRVKITARGRGLVRPAEGIFLVRAPTSGYVRVVQAELGQRVEAGAVLLRLDVPVLAPVAGTVDAIPVHVDEFVTAGTPVAKIIPVSDNLVGFVAIPARYRAHLQPGQTVRLAFDEYPSNEMGFGRGRIRRVSEDIVTPELARSFLASEGSREASYLVEVSLDQMPPRVDARFHNGMPFEGVVAVREQRIITLLFRPLRQLLGD